MAAKEELCGTEERNREKKKDDSDDKECMSRMNGNLLEIIKKQKKFFLELFIQIFFI